MLWLVGLVLASCAYVLYRRQTRRWQHELMLDWAEFTSYDKMVARERRFNTEGNELTGLHKRAVRLALRGSCYGFHECEPMFKRFLSKFEHPDKALLENGQELALFMEEVRKSALRAKAGNNPGLYERLLLWRADISQWADIAANNVARLARAAASQSKALA